MRAGRGFFSVAPGRRLKPGSAFALGTWKGPCQKGLHWSARAWAESEGTGRREERSGPQGSLPRLFGEPVKGGP